MTRELFGTDGVRGLAGEYPLNDEGAQRIGRAVGTHFAQAGQQILIGCDPRESSAQLVKALTEGLNSVGINVVSAGMLPTPGLAYITREHDEFVAGIMVTASHNPYQYNGIKVFDANGGKLPDNTEAIINHLIEEGAPDRGQGNFSEDHNLIHQYEDFLVNSTSGLQLNGLQIAVDAANGAASGLATRVLERLGATVTSLSDRPDGRNINAGCGATDTKALQQVVVDQKLALGIALDGDADRIIMVDHQGREVRGDYLLYILAITNHAPGIVATVMSNVAFEKELTRRGIELVRAAVGDRYVLEELLKTGYKFGGEEAGHIIMMDLLQTGDGLLAAAQTLKALAESGKMLAQWCDEVELIPQAIVNVPVTDKSLLNQPNIQAFIAEQNSRLNEGRLLIRPSGTEPVVRVMVEAPQARAKADQIALELQQLLNQTDSAINFPTDFVNQTRPLTEEMFSGNDAELARQLAEKGYEVHVGLTTAYAEDIIKMCLQASIREYCPNDSGRRFKDLQSTREWLAKGRAAILLLKRDGEQLSLAGYGWGGTETNPRVPGGETTFALRIGEQNQGQGLATPYCRLIVAGNALLYNAKNFWLETWASDGAAVHIYHKIGFEDVDQEPGQRPTAAGDLVADTRLYMSLVNELLP